MDKQYWIDFFFAIWDLIKIFLLIGFIGFLIFIYMSLVPWWVSICILLTAWVCYWAHNQAVDKGIERMQIDEEILRQEERIAQYEKENANFIETVKTLEDGKLRDGYIETIQWQEKEIERIKKDIERLQLHRTIV